MPIMSVKHPTWPCLTKELRAIVGLPSKLPDGFRGPWKVQGYVVRLVSRDYARLFSNTTARKPHRLFATCKGCGRQIPAGKLAQHEKSCSQQ